MDFEELLNELGKWAGKEIKRNIDKAEKRKKKIMQLSEKYNSLSLHELKDKIENGSTDEVLAAKLQLKNRGYGK